MDLIIKNKFLKLILVMSAFFSITKIYTFSIGSLFGAQKNRNFNWCKKNPEVVIVGVGAVILGVPFAFYCLKNILYEKRLRSHCIRCNKENKECSCSLLEKMSYVFGSYGYLRVEKYNNNNRHICRYCRWKTKEIKAELSKINNINIKFPIGSNFTTALHFACQYGHGPIIRWLVENMFVDISIRDGFGALPGDILKNKVPYYRRKDLNTFDCDDKLFCDVDRFFLEKKMEQQKKLFSYVQNLLVLLKEYNFHNTSDIYSILKKIKKLFYSKRTPGFAKQLIMPDLVLIHKNFSTFVTEKDIRAFYRYIAFNYTFLHDTRFLTAVEFAKSKDFKDIRGRTIQEAEQVYKEENKGIKTGNPFSFFSFLNIDDILNSANRNLIHY